MPADATHKLAKHILNNRYVLGNPLGVGGMGTVFEAYDRLTGETVALKHVQNMSRQNIGEMSADDRNDARIALSMEFRTLASLRHPNIITVIDYGFDESQQPFFTMTLLRNTQNIVEAGLKQTVEGKTRLLVQMLQALAYLHRRDIIHRDLKPANVLVTAEGVVKVLDFGVVLNERKSITGQQEITVGTLSYMAPELFLEQTATVQSDLYAVGVMAYRMFSGKHPFNNQNMASLVNSVMRSQPNLSVIDWRIAHVIGRLLAKRPDDRYENAESVIGALCDALDMDVPAENVAIRESFLQASRFVGREQELSALREALQDIANYERPQGSAWLIGGESGVGKSRLVEELRIRALIYGVQVFRAQCIADSALPYHAWREPLRRIALSTHIEPDEASVLKAIIPDLAELIGQDIDHIPALEGMEIRTRLSETITALFRRQIQPTLLIMEDLHWADETLTTLRTIINRTQELPLMVIGTYRDDERAEIPDLLPEASLINLGRLPDNAIAELSESMLGKAGSDPRLIQMIKRETEGNVFFIVEVMRTLAEQAGGLNHIHARQMPQNIVSGDIQRIVQERLRTVPEDAQTLLKFAAIIGRQIDLDMLNALNKQRQVFIGPEYETITVENWLTICANSAVLEAEEGQWRFSHDKLREGVFATMTTNERVMLYKQVAEVTEALYQDEPNKIAALADYWREAQEPDKEFYYVRLAIDEANHINAFKETIHYLERAINLLRSHPIEPDWQHLAADLKIQLGETHGYLAAFDEARKHLIESAELSRKLGNRHTLARAMNALGDIDHDQGEYESATRNHRISLALFREVNDVRGMTNALTDLGRNAQSKNDYEDAHKHYEEALRMCRQTNDFPGIVECLELLGNVSLRQGNLPDAKRYYEESLAFIRDMGDFSRVAGMLDNLGDVARRNRDYSTAQIYYNESLAIYRRISNLLGAALVLSNLGSIALIQQNMMSAQTYCEESLSIFREIDNRLGIAVSLTSLGNVAMQQNNLVRAREYYQEALVISQGAVIRGGIASGYNHLGWVEEVDRDDLTAAVYYTSALKLYREMGEREKIAQTLNHLGFVNIRLGTLDEARDALDESLEIAWNIGATQTLLGAVLGFAQLAYIDGQHKRSAELIGLVSQEIDVEDTIIKRRLEPLLKQLESSTDANALLAALEYGRIALDLENVVDQLLNLP